MNKGRIQVLVVGGKFKKFVNKVKHTTGQLLKFSAKPNASLVIYLIDSRTWINANFFLKTSNSISKNKPLKDFLNEKLVKKPYRRFNVLAFPAAKDFPYPDNPGEFLGELYLDPDYINSQGQNLQFMVIHGFLHLFGYDHRTRNDTIKMRKREQYLIKKLAIDSTASF